MRIEVKAALMLAFMLASIPAWAAPELRFIGEQVLPPGTAYEGMVVGGLSGLAYDEASNTFLAISDDRSDKAPARFYALTLDFDATAFRAMTVMGLTILRDADGWPFPLGRVDPEGIALTPSGDLLWVSEGAANAGVDPFVALARRDGTLLRRFPLPPRMKADPGGVSGVRDNLAFEGAAMMADGTVAVALENALVQDGPAASRQAFSPARIGFYDPATGGLLREVVYDVSRIPAVPPDLAKPGDNGISDILALDPETLIVMERSFTPGVGNTIRLYRAALSGATDVKAIDSLQGAEVRPLEKTLLFDFAATGAPLDNFEGMSWGPRLADGSRSLVVVSDDNFSPAQKTKAFVFAVRD